MPLQKVLSGYRISLPKKFYEHNNISVGDWVIVEQTDTKIIVTPVVLEVKEKKP